MGLETEYGVTCVVDGQRRLSPDEVARYLFRKVVVWGRSSNVFLPNGGRLYLDVGSHPEYATAECDNLSDLIKQDQAGDRIVEELAVSAEIRLNAEGINGQIHLFKNNMDAAGNSYGCHENFSVSRKKNFEEVTESIIPFLITRQIFVAPVNGFPAQRVQISKSVKELNTCGNLFLVPQQDLDQLLIQEMNHTLILMNIEDYT